MEVEIYHMVTGLYSRTLQLPAENGKQPANEERTEVFLDPLNWVPSVHIARI